MRFHENVVNVRIILLTGIFENVFKNVYTYRVLFSR